MAEGEKISILVVDDNESKLVSLEAVLSQLDVEVVRATSGKEALRILLRQDFPAILLDVNMPGMDGFETAALIRARKRSESTPILFITAYGDEPHIARGYALGAVDYILTPVIPDVLRTKVGVFVELYRKSREVQMQSERLARRADQLAALAAELTHTEQRERRRIAQILHDDLQQLLVASRMRLTVLDQELPTRHPMISQINDLIGKAIESSRSLTSQLSPSILYEAGLEAALEWLGRQMRHNHGLAVDLVVEEIEEFAAEPLRAFIFQAISELLFNCVKHSEVKQAVVTINRMGDSIQVQVQDSGKGFNLEAIDASSGENHFGLFSIRERVRLLNGRFGVVTSPGKGTKVKLLFPVRAVASENGTQSEENPATNIPERVSAAHINHAPRRHPNQKKKIRVLLVDDHEVLRKGLGSLLAKQPDIQVIGEAVDGLQAIEFARSLQPDVIVMDISMPGITGIETTRRIKREHPEVHIIGLSMHQREDMAAAMSLVGAAAYLSKGGPPEALVAAIRSAALSKPAAIGERKSG